MTARNDYRVEHIRDLLAPERERPVVAPNRSHTRGDLDGVSYVDYPPEPWGHQQFLVPGGVSDVTDRVALARTRYRQEDHELIGMPTPGQRRHRTERALERLRVVGTAPPAGIRLRRPGWTKSFAEWK